MQSIVKVFGRDAEDLEETHTGRRRILQLEPNPGPSYSEATVVNTMPPSCTVAANSQSLLANLHIISSSMK